MKHSIISIIILSSVLAMPGQAELAAVLKPADLSVAGSGESAVITWRNPEAYEFDAVELFRSPIPIEEYFSHEAVAGLCDKIYEGREESYADSGLAANLPYYYILFAKYRSGEYSPAVVAERKPVKTGGEAGERTTTLAGADSETVTRVSFNEAGLVFNYNQPLELEPGSEDRRLALFIIAKSPHDLTEEDRNSISFFIHEGTPTTILLGSGERAGVLNSYLSVFDKLPTGIPEWQDVIKIANGRWPRQRSLEAETAASETHFSAVYRRAPDMDDPHDNAAVTVIAYGLRPAARDLANEKAAISTFRSIFKRAPTEAVDWDIIRAIAYSGAIR